MATFFCVIPNRKKNATDSSSCGQCPPYPSPLNYFYVSPDNQIIVLPKKFPTTQGEIGNQAKIQFKLIAN
jgi:hypothetical protein